MASATQQATNRALPANNYLPPTTRAGTVNLSLLAGMLYLTIILSGACGELLIRTLLVDTTSSLLTLENIQTNIGLFKLIFVLNTLMVLCDITLAVLLYYLLTPYSPILATLSLVFRLCQAFILCINLLEYYSPALLLDSSLATVMSKPQIAGKVELNFSMYSYGYDFALIFFSLSNLFLGMAILKTKWFSSVISYGLWLAAAVYMFGSISRFIEPNLAESTSSLYLIPFVAEAAFCACLLSTIRNKQGDKDDYQK